MTNALHAELDTWLSNVILNENPTVEIVAFRVGLGETVEGYVLYLAGSTTYDEADDEWATFPPEFVAKNELHIPNEIEQEWYWILLSVIHSLGRILRKQPANQSFLGGTIPVYTGFESGNLYRIK
jgi:hypothetical protein